MRKDLRTRNTSPLNVCDVELIIDESRRAMLVGRPSTKAIVGYQDVNCLGYPFMSGVMYVVASWMEISDVQDC